MRIKNPERRIKELTKDFNRISRIIYQNNNYTIRTFKKGNIKKLDREGIIQTLNGQSHFLKIQKNALSRERWRERELILELRYLYRYIQKNA